MIKVVLLTKPSTVHRCDGSKPETVPYWFADLAAALRFYPELTSTIDSMPTTTRVFYCPTCRYVALVPIKPASK